MERNSGQVLVVGAQANSTETEQCIFVSFNEDRCEYIILAVYVGDLVIAGTTQEEIIQVKQ